MGWTSLFSRRRPVENLTPAEEWERDYAAASGVSVQWMREHNRVVVKCSCGDEGCEGYRSINRELAEEEGFAIVVPRGEHL